MIILRLRINSPDILCGNQHFIIYWGGGGDTGCGKWDYRGEKMWEVGL